MKDLRDVFIDVVKYGLAVNLLFSLIIFTFSGNPFPIILGDILGFISSFVNFIILAFSINKAVTMESNEAKLHGTLMYYARLLIWGIAIFSAIKIDAIDIKGLLFGILSIKLVLYFINLVDRRKEKR